jgi:hypothetical protein
MVWLATMTKVLVGVFGKTLSNYVGRKKVGKRSEKVTDSHPFHRVGLYQKFWPTLK